ncbi:hypothetical protein E5N72_09840 [Pseudoalteromonas sp. MEBiC 03607]|uniref:hypothetical protein n=1 Tax=unclassified Pseudoalteromonas TaxID=194690 RepID=UPI0010934327|nr:MULTISPECIES: hypothetical protein [unclassified Pseudoalteromonas]TGV20347.1 hypothetical protein E5N72_09840 [Pseudoalteromonas sp. MEBiC 03607]TMO41968.1 hypothetical protein CWC25_18010 [Pseudoalteromonas sp. S4389]
MFESIQNLYKELMVATENHQVISMQVIIAVMYVLAFAISLFRAIGNRERFSDFLSIATVVTKYALTSLLMEYVLIFIAENQSIGNTQNIYLVACLINLLSIYILYLLHTKFSFNFGLLFFCVIKLTVVLSLAHFILWFKFVVLDIQAEHAYIHYIYSFIVLYISFTLAIVMLFPGLLKTKLKLLLSPSWPFHTKI